MGKKQEKNSLPLLTDADVNAILELSKQGLSAEEIRGMVDAQFKERQSWRKFQLDRFRWVQKIAAEVAVILGALATIATLILKLGGVL
jgi:type IV secretory pathway component VirB8